MKHTPLIDVLQDALEKKYAVPAFNAWTFQDALALVRAAEEANSPLILQTSGTCLAHNGLDFSFHMVDNAAANAKVPVVIHLDHAEDKEVIKQALSLGYSSVMYDGSKLPLEENIQNTITAKSWASFFRASVEAEIGHVAKGEGDEEILTTPKEAKEFFARTSVDALAVAVGTRHGMQKREAPLNFKALKALTRAVNAPLVLHGSSGVRDKDLPKVAKSSVCKVNIATRLRRVFIEAMAELSPKYKGGDHIELLMQAHESTIKEAIHIMGLLGSTNRA